MADRPVAPNVARYESNINRRVELSADLVREMGMSVEAYQRSALNALVRTPELADCTPESVDRALLDTIEAGLTPDGVHAAIATFRDRKRGVLTAQLMVMAEGRVLLARRAVQGLSVQARVVYREDEWDYAEGLDERLHHVPAQDGDRSDAAVIAAYAIARYPGGGTEWVWLWRSDIERYRAIGRSPAWDSDYAAMARKTAILRLRLPRRPTDPPDWREDERAGPADVGIDAAVSPRIVGPALPSPTGDGGGTSQGAEPEGARNPPAAEPSQEGDLDDSPF